MIGIRQSHKKGQDEKFYFIFVKKKDENLTHGFTSLPDDGLIISPIFQNMSRDPSGIKNDTSMDIFC